MYDVNITAQTLLRNSTYLLPRCVATASALGCVCTASIVFGGKWGGGYFVVLYLYHSILNVLPCSFSILLCFCTDIIIRLFCGRVVLFYLCSGTAPTCAARLDRYRYPRFLVDLAFGVDGVRWQFARTATPYRSLLRKSLPYRRGTRSGR